MVSHTLLHLLLILHQFSAPHKNAHGLRVAAGNGTLAKAEGRGDFHAVAATTRRPGRRRTTPHHPHTTHRPIGEEEDGSYYDEGDDHVTVGPIIIPAGDSSITEESSEEESEELVPIPNRAENCHSLSHLCHQHAYRRLLQRFCQTTCGRDNCMDQREDLCIHWQRRGFCTHPFYADMRWRCARTCGICRPIHP